MKRSLFSSEIVRIYPNGSGSGQLLPILQSVDASISPQRVSRSRLSRFSDDPTRQLSSYPKISANFSYIPTGKSVEEAIGLTGPNSVCDYLYSGYYEKNISNCKVSYTNQAGGAQSSILLESGVLTNYSFQASSKTLPQVSLSFEYLDCHFNESDPYVPSIEEQRPLVPQKINITLPEGMVGIKDYSTRSVNVSIPIGWSQDNRVGRLKPKNRILQNGAVATIQTEFTIIEISGTSLIDEYNQDLFQLTSGSAMDGNIEISISETDCNSTGIAMTFLATSPYLDDLSLIGSSNSSSLYRASFSVPISPFIGESQSNLKIY